VLTEELPAEGWCSKWPAGPASTRCTFARTYPRLTWQPSDPDPEALESIAAWRAEAGLVNLREPVLFDVTAADWPVPAADAVLCINMIHISPVAATEGLLAGAAALLAPGAPLIVYGPFLEAAVETAPSNLEFDAWLKRRDPGFGLRSAEWLDGLAAARGFARTRRVAMPANNLTLVYRKR
jgi:hypothetical protein